MISAGEIDFVAEVLYDLASIADPNEYFEGEVREALDVLASLKLESNEISLESNQPSTAQQLDTQMLTIESERIIMTPEDIAALVEELKGASTEDVEKRLEGLDDATRKQVTEELAFLSNPVATQDEEAAE